MKARLGGIYKDREGKIIGPLVPNTAESQRQGFAFKHLHRSYNVKGAYRIRGKRWGDTSRFDLVQEIAHVHAPAP